MFVVTSTRAIELPGFPLRRGANTYPSRQSVPVALWPKLERFRSLGLLAFDGEATAGDDAPKLAELSQAQLFAMGKAELATLARSHGVLVMDDVSKAQLLEALTTAQGEA